MATKTNWQPGSTVCRCCFAEGCYKDISTEYFWMGKREVYSEMLLDTFDVSISYALSGPNSNSRLICEPCISRLRDATDFKRQVQECERTFMTHLNPVAVASTSVEALPESEKEELKLEQIKVEIKLDEPNYDDDDHAFQDDDDDDMDDQPLTALASKVPKKETMDLSDLLDNAKPEKLKRKIATKAKASPAKKAKKEVKPSASKAKEDDKKKKARSDIEESRENAKKILKHTTALPFRVMKDGKMTCVYCTFSADSPELIREHISTHPLDVRAALRHQKLIYFPKIDCSELSCRKCNTDFPTVTSAAKHISEAHSVKINFETELGVQEFRFNNERWSCCMCRSRFPTFRQLSRHTASHYNRYICETCGKLYNTIMSLNRHVLSVHRDDKICIHCKTTFQNKEEKKQHVSESKKCWPNVCYICGERFITKYDKYDHLEEKHEKEKKKNKCAECSNVFDTYAEYHRHFIMAHTNDSLKCPSCDKEFTQKRYLEDHLILHSNVKKFSCQTCSKSFALKKYLTQHQCKHRKFERVTCGACNKIFKGKFSLRTHMYNVHPEITLKFPRAAKNK